MNLDLPTSVPSPLGPVTVTIVPDLKDKDGTPCMGIYRSAMRTIDICAGMAPLVAVQVLWHEWLHCILSDSGTQLKRKQEEAVCDAIATALTALFITSSSEKA